MCAAYNVPAFILGVGPQDDPEGGRVLCEVALDVLKELASVEGVVAAGACMHNEGFFLPSGLQIAKLQFVICYGSTVGWLLWLVCVCLATADACKHNEGFFLPPACLQTTILQFVKSYECNVVWPL